MSQAPKDVADYAEARSTIWDLAQRNPEVSRTLVGIIDTMNEMFGESIKEVQVKGPTGSIKPYDFQFKLEAK